MIFPLGLSELHQLFLDPKFLIQIRSSDALLSQVITGLMPRYKAEHLLMPHGTDFTALLLNKSNPSAFVPYHLWSYQSC